MLIQIVHRHLLAAIINAETLVRVHVERTLCVELYHTLQFVLVQVITLAIHLYDVWKVKLMSYFVRTDYSILIKFNLLILPMFLQFMELKPSKNHHVRIVAQMQIALIASAGAAQTS